MAHEIFVNLKRFEVPRRLGGVCDHEDPAEWAGFVIDEAVKLGLGQLEDVRLTFFFPEALLVTAHKHLRGHEVSLTRSIALGSQGVHREDIAIGGNFGAFTTHRPARAVKHLGCLWTIIGHSEERRDKWNLLARMEPGIQSDPELGEKARAVVDGVIQEEVRAALGAGLNVLLCVGETAAERGEGTAAEQETRVRQVLRNQLVRGLPGGEGLGGEVVIAYEPVWAIGPGRVPPEPEYIRFASSYIKDVVRQELGFWPKVVYGGGLKEENAAAVAGIPSIDGGLVALTRFAGQIGFEPAGLSRIVDQYRQGGKG